MKQGIMNLNKWAEKTAQAVRYICSRQQAPCVGFSLIFFDPLAELDKRWGYVIELAFDPHNPPSDEEKKRLQEAFGFINEGVKRILGGGEELEENDLLQYIVQEGRKDLH